MQLTGGSSGACVGVGRVSVGVLRSLDLQPRVSSTCSVRDDD